MSDSFQPEQVAQPVHVPESPGMISPPMAPFSPNQARAQAPPDAVSAHEVKPHQEESFRPQATVDAAQAGRAEEADWDTEVAPNVGPTRERRIPLLGGRRKGRRLVRREENSRTPLTPEQRLLILDTWQRSGLPA